MNTDIAFIEMLAQHQALLDRLTQTDAGAEDGEIVFPELHEGGEEG